MNNFNPYAPPQSIGGAPDADTCYRNGKKVYLIDGGDLPPRCIRCNAPVDTTTKPRKIYWHHPAIYLLLLLGLPLRGMGVLAYIFVALIARRSAWISPALCPHHAAVRRNIIIASWLILLAGLSAMFVFSPNAALLIGLLLLAFLIMAVFLTRWVYPTKITSDEIYLGGVGKPFLESLPDYPLAKKPHSANSRN